MGQPVDFVAFVLWIHVVKIEHERITLAAIDACLAVDGREILPVGGHEVPRWWP